MTRDDILRLEQRFELVLPEDYVSAVTPARSADVLTFPESLITDPVALAGINDEVRFDEFSEEWDPHWFVIGHDACGDLYFIDVSSAGLPVLMQDHETHDTSVVAPSIEKFLESERANPTR